MRSQITLQDAAKYLEEAGHGVLEVNEHTEEYDASIELAGGVTMGFNEEVGILLMKEVGGMIHGKYCHSFVEAMIFLEKSNWFPQQASAPKNLDKVGSRSDYVPIDMGIFAPNKNRGS